jgi:transposase
MHRVALLDALKKWLDEQAPQVLPESLTSQATKYTRNQWEYLSR